MLSGVIGFTIDVECDDATFVDTSFISVRLRLLRDTRRFTRFLARVVEVVVAIDELSASMISSSSPPSVGSVSSPDAVNADRLLLLLLLLRDHERLDLDRAFITDGDDGEDDGVAPTDSMTII